MAIPMITKAIITADPQTHQVRGAFRKTPYRSIRKSAPGYIRSRVLLLHPSAIRKRIASEVRRIFHGSRNGIRRGEDNSNQYQHLDPVGGGLERRKRIILTARSRIFARCLTRESLSGRDYRKKFPASRM
jgi:hypothetical protein